MMRPAAAAGRTRISGDGTLKTVVLPMSGLPAEFFRIVTQ
jgi:hypothetical protein